MELQEVMAQKRFAVAGDTLNPEKYAWKIKNRMLAAGYTVSAVGKELASFNEVPGDIDVIDLCIHPARGLKLMRENRKPVKCVVIQPGAESPELLDYLKTAGIPFLQSCLLVGLARWRQDVVFDD